MVWIDHSQQNPDKYNEECALAN